jgi:hypothetical protein
MSTLYRAVRVRHTHLESSNVDCNLAYLDYDFGISVEDVRNLVPEDHKKRAAKVKELVKK